MSYEEDRDWLLRKMSIKITTDMSITGKVPEDIHAIEAEAAQAIDRLVIEARIDELNKALEVVQEKNDVAILNWFDAQLDTLQQSLKKGKQQ